MVNFKGEQVTQSVPLKRNGWTFYTNFLRSFPKVQRPFFPGQKYGCVVAQVQANLGDKRACYLKSELSLKTLSISQYLWEDTTFGSVGFWSCVSALMPVPPPPLSLKGAEGTKCFIFPRQRVFHSELYLLSLSLWGWVEQAYAVAPVRINTASRNTFLWCL